MENTLRRELFNLAKTLTMDELLAGSDVKPLKTGDMVEGVITSVKKHEVWVDMGANGVGVILRREVGSNNLQEGEQVSASVVDPELDEGYALLSMKRAVKDRGWGELQRVFEAQEIVEVIAYDANRGGLLIELEGIRGFLPVSQLAAGLLFFTLGLDREIIRAFARSLDAFPAGSFALAPAGAEQILRLASGMFSVGLRLAMPAIALLLLVDLALALLGRLNAQLQLLVLAFPVKMMAAIALLATLAVLFPRVYRDYAGQVLARVTSIAGF